VNKVSLGKHGSFGTIVKNLWEQDFIDLEGIRKWAIAILSSKGNIHVIAHSKLILVSLNFYPACLCMHKNFVGE